MTFFPDPSELPEPAEPPNYPPLPVWLSPPLDMIPGIADVQLTLGRSESTVVFVPVIRAFPSGLDITLSVRCRGPVRSQELSRNLVQDLHHRADRDTAWQARRLKWGFEFADGRRVTNLDMDARSNRMFHRGQADPATDSPVLLSCGGGGGDRSWDMDYWLWPLPPPGRFRIVCQWVDQGITQTVQDLDAQLLLEAADRARPIWPIT